MKPLRTLNCLARPIFRTPYICNNCLHTSTRLQRPSNPAPPPSSAYTLLPSRRIISLSGPDATHYLQGVITANLSPAVARTSGFYAAFLNAQGRILNDVFIYPDPKAEAGGWLIEVDSEEAERLAKHIRRYKLRAKFEVRVVGQEEMGVWSLWEGEEGPWTQHSLGEAGGERKLRGEEVGCGDKRAPGMGRRLLLPWGKKPEMDMEETTEDVYRVRRYLKGVPEGQKELIREAALPQESNVDFMGGVDYRKGCYVGQELTIRTHHTGVVRKRILPVMLYEKDTPMPQSLEYLPESHFGVEGITEDTASIGRFEKRGRSAGKWLTGVGNIGLGLCRLEIMTDIQAQGEGAGYKEGDEFTLNWDDKQMKIKAFVPPWHLTK